MKTVVIGGGLLGLEAARGLQLRGCDVSVVHLMDTLMERQLDPTGGAYLQRKIESLGIRVLLPQADTGAARKRPRRRSAFRIRRGVGSGPGGDRGGNQTQRGLGSQERDSRCGAAS